MTFGTGSPCASGQTARTQEVSKGAEAQFCMMEVCILKPRTRPFIVVNKPAYPSPLGW